MLVPSIFGEDLFDSFFEDFARPTRNVARYNAPASPVMRTDVKETDTGYELDIDLPGYKKENVQVELKDGCLTVAAKTEQNKDEMSEYIENVIAFASEQGIVIPDIEEYKHSY